MQGRKRIHPKLPFKLRDSKLPFTAQFFKAGFKTSAISLALTKDFGFH